MTRLTNHRKGDNVGIGNSGCSTVTEGSPNCAAGRGDETRAAMDPHRPKPDVSSSRRSPAPTIASTLVADEVGDGSDHPPPLLEDRLSEVRNRFQERRCATGSGTRPHEPARAVTAASICHQAGDLVGGDRGTLHGDKTTNHQNIAAAWNAILQAKARRAGWPVHDVFVTLDAHDVANMMEALKVMRRYSGAYNPDDYVDGAGYAGVAGEIAHEFSRSPAARSDQTGGDR